MYISADTIIKAAAVVGALGVLAGVIIAVYKRLSSVMHCRAPCRG